MKAIKIACSFFMGVMILLAFIVTAYAMEFTAEDIYESVFVIYSGNSLGSGFAIGENCIITNAHVVCDPENVIVKSYEGTEYTAAVLGMDPDRDLAVLGVNEAKFPFLPFADISQMKTGDDIYTIGAPKSMSYTLTKGVISAKERIVGGYSYIQIDAAINEGNSGGPLINNEGHVLGINTLKVVDSEGIGLAITTADLRIYLKSLGFQLDKSGNIEGTVQIPIVNGNSQQQTENKNHENLDNEKIIDRNLPFLTIAAFILSGLSITGNIILTILLIYQKRKNIILQYNPKERTDFDIDILE